MIGGAGYSMSNQSSATGRSDAGGGVGNFTFNIGGNPALSALASNRHLPWIVGGVAVAFLFLWKRK